MYIIESLLSNILNLQQHRTFIRALNITIYSQILPRILYSGRQSAQHLKRTLSVATTFSKRIALAMRTPMIDLSYFPWVIYVLSTLIPAHKHISQKTSLRDSQPRNTNAHYGMVLQHWIFCNIFHSFKAVSNELTTVTAFE